MAKGKAGDGKGGGKGRFQSGDKRGNGMPAVAADGAEKSAKALKRAASRQRKNDAKKAQQDTAKVDAVPAAKAEPKANAKAKANVKLNRWLWLWRWLLIVMAPRPPLLLRILQ